MPASFPPATRVLIRNASIPGPMMREAGVIGRCDLLIEGGAILRIGVAGTLPSEGTTVHDLDGGLVLPAFADVHTHLDKGHIWPRRPNPDGTWLSALLSVV